MCDDNFTSHKRRASMNYRCPDYDHGPHFKSRPNPAINPVESCRAISALDLHGADSFLVEEVMMSTSSILTSTQSLSPPDRSRFVLFGVGAQKRPSFLAIHHVFAYHAKQRPDSIAAEHMSQSITFDTLDYLSTALATHLRACRISPGTRICLLFRRSLSMVVAILGVLKAGASYVPLDGGIVTDSTLSFILRDSKASYVLFLEDFRSRLPLGTAGICLDDFMNQQTNHIAPEVELVDQSAPHHEAYVIYTSGTTGTPKGVSVSHGNVTNCKLAMRPGSKVAQLLNVAFDMCAWEVLGSLMNGCTLCIRGTTREDWKTVMQTVDVVIATPTILNQFSPEDYPNIRCAATAGEPCPQSLADRWSRAGLFYNCCGPTEVTIVNTVHRHRLGEINCIGTPTPNNSVYVLDSSMRPLPIGKTGIMWASGSGVAGGYLNLPELTSQRWVKDPFRNDGTLMFNTGDLGRWTTNGQLEHLGRVDDQVKIKGFRVELDSVAAAMLTCSGVDQALALAVDGELWAFLAPKDVDLEHLKRVTSSILPYYAVPSGYILLNELPMTSNGKADKSVLRSQVKIRLLEKKGDPACQNTHMLSSNGGFIGHLTLAALAKLFLALCIGYVLRFTG